jgi:hypothetical protein
LRLLNTVLLITAAVVLAAGNIWYAAARSTIPLSLHDQVVDIEMRREKHPGKDDVYLLQLRSGRVLQIDPTIARVITPGSQISKDAWSRTLQIDSQAMDLKWSPDFYGMIRAMPAMMLLLLATAAVIDMTRRLGACRAREY